MFGEDDRDVRLTIPFALLLTACADDFAVAQVPSQPSVVQNIGYTTNIYSQPATLMATTTQTPEEVTVEQPPTPRVIVEPAPVDTPLGVRVLPPPS